MQPKIYSKEDGLLPADLVLCGIDHLDAAKTLFNSNPNYFDAAGYLAHIGVELLLKGWHLESFGYFKGTHKLCTLYNQLVIGSRAQSLDKRLEKVLSKLDEYENLRYPNLENPTEVGQGDWQEIEALIKNFCDSMPSTIVQALQNIPFGQKAGRVLMKKKI